MKASVLEKRERFVLCPQCGDAASHRVTDLEPESPARRSFCRSCGLGVVSRARRGGEVFVEELPERALPNYVLLRLVPQERPVYLVVRDLVCERPAGAGEDEEDAFFRSQEFLYNHQLRPRVYVGKSVVILREGDEDSYGLFEYVASHPRPPSPRPDEDERDAVFRIFGGPLGLASEGGGDEGGPGRHVIMDAAEKMIG